MCPWLGDWFCPCFEFWGSDVGSLCFALCFVLDLILILGLSFGFVCCLLALLWVWDCVVVILSGFWFRMPYVSYFGFGFSGLFAVVCTLLTGDVL